MISPAIKLGFFMGIICINQHLLITQGFNRVQQCCWPLHLGANTAWVLIADTIAGALLVLSITGALLWTKMRGSRIAMVP